MQTQVDQSPCKVGYVVLLCYYVRGGMRRLRGQKPSWGVGSVGESARKDNPSERYLFSHLRKMWPYWRDVKVKGS